MVHALSPENTKLQFFRSRFLRCINEVLNPSFITLAVFVRRRNSSLLAFVQGKQTP
jgi:hypothetical protein